MSSIQVSGTARALPFTGFAALPFFIIGGALSVTGAAMTFLRRRRSAPMRLK